MEKALGAVCRYGSKQATVVTHRPGESRARHTPCIDRRVTNLEQRGQLLPDCDGPGVTIGVALLCYGTRVQMVGLGVLSTGSEGSNDGRR
jgi:hypothetical protein